MRRFLSACRRYRLPRPQLALLGVGGPPVMNIPVTSGFVARLYQGEWSPQSM